MTQQQLTIKAYYNDLNDLAPEIRRFALNVTTDNDVFRELEDHVTQLNSDYVRGEFTLQYVDEDQDRITFSSNAELRVALSTVAVPNGTLKVYVKPKAKKVEQQQATGGEAPVVHPGITCDGCQGSVVGIRYKCMECPDYDLCETCNEKKIHSQHNMIKLTRPGFGGGRRCGRGGGFGGRCGRGGPRFWGPRHHAHQQQQREQEASFQMPPHIADFLGQFKGKELAELVEAHLPAWLRTEKIQEVLSTLKTGEQADKPVDQANILEHVGKFLQEVLSPFGIDCDYWVDNKNKAAESTTTTSAPPAAPTTEEVKQEEAPQAAAASASTATEPKPEPAAAAASASAVNLFEQLQSMFGPMLAQGGFPPKAAAATTAPINTADEEQREKKKVEECVERLTSLGFLDTNGVLTELVKSKKGDMNQVLDALNPRNYKN